MCKEWGTGVKSVNTDKERKVGEWKQIAQELSKVAQ